MLHTTKHELEFLQSLPLESLRNYARAFKKRAVFIHKGASARGNFETVINKSQIESYLNRYVNLSNNNCD